MSLKNLVDGEKLAYFLTKLRAEIAASGTGGSGIEVVDSLPTTGEDGKVYAYNNELYQYKNNAWVKIIDLSDLAVGEHTHVLADITDLYEDEDELVEQILNNKSDIEQIKETIQILETWDESHFLSRDDFNTITAFPTGDAIVEKCMYLLENEVTVSGTTYKPGLYRYNTGTSSWTGVIVSHDSLDNYVTNTALTSTLGNYALKADISYIGQIVYWNGKEENIPSNWLLCDGSVYNIADAEQLATWYETQFGTKNNFGGDGTTTFGLPTITAPTLTTYAFNYPCVVWSLDVNVTKPTAVSGEG